MATHRLLALEAVQLCRAKLVEDGDDIPERDAALEHALLLSHQVEQYVLQWPATRLHRALGFIQGVLVSRGCSSLEEQCTLLERLQIGFPECRDRDLADHLDPRQPFELELGGSG